MANTNESFDDLDQLDRVMKGKSIATAAETQTLAQKQKWALTLVAEFATKDGANVWPSLGRFTVSMGLVTRINDPTKINQGFQNLCGVTSVVRAWAQDCPVDYAWLGIQLFETGVGRFGRGQMQGEIIRPSADLKKSAVPKGMHQTDWLILASVHETLVKKHGHAMQDALGAFGGLNYTKDEGFLAYRAWQNPSEVVAAFKATGYSNVIDNTSPTTHKGINDLQQANNLMRDGWRVSLLINARMLDDRFGTQAKLVSSSDHWVGMTELINVMGEYTYPFNVYSWGKSMRVPSDSKVDKMKTADLLLNFYGFVAGRPY
jgi:hypothetical protein